MNREIKFRVFGNSEMMIDWEVLKQLHVGTVFQNTDGYNVMQYTGLKDRNNKEIYEGDIVRILYSDWVSQNSDDTRTINQYLKDIASIKIVVWDYNGFYVANKIGGYAETMEVGKYGYLEVIGNIFENPELLNKQQEGK